MRLQVSVLLLLARYANAFVSNGIGHDSACCCYCRSMRRLQLSANPNDLESSDDRETRMDLVRQLQKSFYQDEDSVDLQSSDRGAGIVENVPILRTQWTELPGSQDILNCEEPYQTHMFMRVVSGAEPWYFGHLCGGEGASNLENSLSDATLTEASIGTLMRISDYRQLEDGRLTLLVQAVSRFRIFEVTQQTLYDMATVELLPDIEMVEAHLDGSMDMAVGGVDFCGAARTAAIAEDRYWQDFELRRVSLDDTSSRGSVLSMANFDARKAVTVALNVEEVMEEYLLHPEADESMFECPIYDSGSIDNVIDLEYKVWVGIDELIRLVTAVSSNQKVTLPIPAQMLGLLPQNPSPRQWPKGFALKNYAAAVGILSPQSLYVSTDSVAPLYPELRRAERLSFVVWLLLDSVAEERKGHIARQEVLEMESVAERLEAARQQLASIILGLREKLRQS